MEGMELVTIYATFGTDQVRYYTIQTTKFWTANFRLPSEQTITAGCGCPKVPTSFEAKLLIQVRLSMLFLPEDVRTSLVRLRNRGEVN
jgi:hypothetical protein